MMSALRNRVPTGKILWVVLGGVYLGWLLLTLRQVPFHPDEATWIYMSRDLDRALAGGPASLCWRPESAGDPLQVERERACPLPRLLIGVSRLLAGRPATARDWNWSASWEENARGGALPADELLFLARLPQGLVLFLSVLLMARIGWRAGGSAGAAAAALLYGLNSQVLLHGRRAMSEAALLFGMTLVAALILECLSVSGGKRRGVVLPALVGTALAAAVSAKLTGLLIAPAAVAGMIALEEPRSVQSVVLRTAVRLGVMASCFIIAFLALNPLYWCHPVDAVPAVAESRNELLTEQVNALRMAAPGQVLDSPMRRLAAAFYEPFLAPPAFWDVPNYSGETAAVESAYLANPMFSLTAREPLPMLWLSLVLIGMTAGILRLARPERRGSMAVLWIWFLGVLAGILLEVPILWQRYYLPLIPVLAAWGGVGATTLIRRLIRFRRPVNSRT
jgi:4-amino-4-deoxy-L-arabinose transferase-like glycosyltransferase